MDREEQKQKRVKSLEQRILDRELLTKKYGLRVVPNKKKYKKPKYKEWEKDIDG